MLGGKVTDVEGVGTAAAEELRAAAVETGIACVIVQGQLVMVSVVA